jgi:hypothetical protein
MESDKTSDAYNLINYDSVFIILKDKAEMYESYKGVVKHDAGKKKYFLSGKLIEDTHPISQTLAFVPETNMEAFKKAKKYIDKKKFMVNIPFGHIDYITLPFESLDWMR